MKVKQTYIWVENTCPSVSGLYRVKALLLLATLLAVSCIPVVCASPKTADSSLLHIADAYYADLDGDSSADDIKILVQFALRDLEPTRVDINLWVTLPSGTTYAFRVNVYKAPSDSTLNIDCINMACESGWYDVKMLASILGLGRGRVSVEDAFSFDPPTGGGPGLPTVSAYF